MPDKDGDVCMIDCFEGSSFCNTQNGSLAGKGQVVCMRCIGFPKLLYKWKSFITYICKNSSSFYAETEWGML